MFYYFNGRLWLTNNFLPVSDGETPVGFEKMSLKALYEMPKDAQSHGHAFLQFSSALNISFVDTLGYQKSPEPSFIKAHLLE